MHRRRGGGGGGDGRGGRGGSASRVNGGGAFNRHRDALEVTKSTPAFLQRMIAAAKGGSGDTGGNKGAEEARRRIAVEMSENGAEEMMPVIVNLDNVSGVSQQDLEAAIQRGEGQSIACSSVKNGTAAAAAAAAADEQARKEEESSGRHVFRPKKKNMKKRQQGGAAEATETGDGEGEGDKKKDRKKKKKKKNKKQRLMLSFE